MQHVLKRFLDAAFLLIFPFHITIYIFWLSFLFSRKKMLSSVSLHADEFGAIQVPFLSMQIQTEAHIFMHLPLTLSITRKDVSESGFF